MWQEKHMKSNSHPLSHQNEILRSQGSIHVCVCVCVCVCVHTAPATFHRTRLLTRRQNIGLSGRPLNVDANVPFYMVFKSLVPSATKVSLSIIACSVIRNGTVKLGKTWKLRDRDFKRYVRSEYSGVWSASSIHPSIHPYKQ